MKSFSSSLFCRAETILLLSGHLVNEGLLSENEFRGVEAINFLIYFASFFYNFPVMINFGVSKITSFEHFNAKVTRSFLQYLSGVFEDLNCVNVTRTNHALLLMGYGIRNRGENEKMLFMRRSR